MACKSIWAQLVDQLLEGTNLMNNLDDAIASLEKAQESRAEILAQIDLVDTKLDEVREFIATLKAGQVTQAQLDKLAALAAASETEQAAVGEKLASVLGEADDLDKAEEA